MTRNASGSPLAGCTIDLYDASRVWQQRTVSDGAGAYSFTLGGNGGVMLVAYLPGSPAVSAASVQFVTPVPA